MEEITTESRLTNLINDYIEYSVKGPLTKRFVIIKGVYHFWYVNPDNEYLFETDDKTMVLGVNRNLFSSVKDIFTLTRDETFRRLRSWFNNETNSNVVEKSYIF